MIKVSKTMLCKLGFIILAVALILVYLKFVPGSPMYHAHWGVVLAPVWLPLLLAFLSFIGFFVKSLVDFTINFKSDDRDP